MNRRSFAFSAAVALIATRAHARTGPTPNFTANDVLERTLPTAPLSEWTDAPGRRREALQVDGAELRGWRYEGGDPRGPTLVIFGGSNNLIRNHDAAYRALAKGVGAVVAFDYRGFGFSTGRAAALQLRTDGVAIVDAVAKRSDGLGKVMVLGYSMGSMIAAFVARERRIGGLVLLAGLSHPDLMAKLYPERLKGLVPAADALDFLDVTASVRRSRSPLLIIHGEKDVAVRIEEGRANYEAADPSSRSFVELTGIGHEDLLANADVQRAVAAFGRTF